MAEVISWRPTQSSSILEKVIPVLLEGGVIVYPTETVYGLGGLVRYDIVERIRKIKKRPSSLGFILLMPSIRHVLNWTYAGQHSRILRLAQAFWPGPLTLVVKASKHVPHFACTDDGTIALRISPHRFCQELLQRIQAPIISTSANIHGHPPARTVQEAIEMLKDVDVFIDGGKLTAGRPSTVLRLQDPSPVILRQGPISADAIERILHVPVIREAPEVGENEVRS